MAQERLGPETGCQRRPLDSAALVWTTAAEQIVPESAAPSSLPAGPGRPPTDSRDLHTGELALLGDALLQQSTILAVIQMATALALQRLTNYFAGQPGSKDNNIP